MTTPQKPWRPALQINTAQVPNSKIASSRKVAMVDPRDPTAFNTLSNVYATVVDRSTPVEPVTAINTHQPLRIQTGAELKNVQSRTQTPYASVAPTYPETPLTANPKSPMNNPEFIFPSTMTATPPMSAGPVDNQVPTFTFTPPEGGSAPGPAPKLSLNTSVAGAVSSRPIERSPTPRTPKRTRTLPTSTSPPLPYTHPRTLHSILRNSPLPHPSVRAPLSPRRQSARLQEKAAKRVCYNNPLTQTITNSKYILSHVDLLAEDASPSPMSPAVIAETVTPYADSNETRDGGMTPGPMEDIRRKMAVLGASSPLTTPGGIRKRKKKERRRQWAWTINQEDDDEEVGGAIAAIRAAEAAKTAGTENEGHDSDMMAAESSPPQPPLLLQPTVYVPPPAGRGHERTPSLASQDSQDVEMSDSSSFMSEDSFSMDIDELTPMVERKDFAMSGAVMVRRSSVGDELGNPGRRQDSPVPPSLLIA